MYLIVIISLFAVALADPPQFDSDADDCCALTWEPVIDAGSRRFIPKSAIPFVRNHFNSNVYFARRADLSAPQGGLIDERIEEGVYLWQLSESRVNLQKWTNTWILSNPNNCALEWQTNENRALFNRTRAIEYPSIDGYFFARDYLNNVAITQNREKSFGIDPDFNNTVAANASMFKVVSIDCAASLRLTLEAELFDIEFDTNGLMQGRGLNTLALTEVVNDSDFDQEATIDLESEVLSSLVMSHEMELSSMINTKWGVHVTPKTGWLGKLFGLSVPVDGANDARSVKTNFTRTGKVSFDSKRKRFNYNQKILIKARSKTNVTMNTQPIGGSQKYKAHYRIASVQANRNVTLGQASNLLRRQGFPGWNTLQLDASGNIVFSVEGHMEMDTSVDTHILMQSSPLGNSSQSVNWSRVVRGLDPIPLPPQ